MERRGRNFTPQSLRQSGHGGSILRQIVGRPAGRGVIAVPAGRHEGLGAVIGGFGEVAAYEGDRATGAQRMPLDGMLALPTGLRAGLLEPLEALLMPAEPRLRDAVQERQRG
jgi:hypothetical protein